jgi:hypothetical protein
MADEPMTKQFPTPFRVTFDMSTEGYDNFWQAHGAIVEEARLDGASIHNTEYIGDAPNGWPMIAVTFDCIESAKEYTASYLGLGPINGAWDVYMDDEVNDYLLSGKFI